MIISSQKYLDQEVVDQKIQENDFLVTLSPEFEIDGQVMQVLLDGHHSFHAAKEAGVEPQFNVADVTENDRIAILEAGDIDGYLEAEFMDSDWYDVETGISVF